MDRLEGRELMAFAGSLDPTFGGKGAVFIPVQTTSGVASGLVNLTQAAVAIDNSVIAAGPLASGHGVGLIRIRDDGSRDTSSGTGGEADIALPAGASLSGILQFPPIFGSTNPTLVLSVANSANPTEVVRPLPNGQLDPSFGTGGVVALGPANLGFNGSFDHVVYLTDGRIALAGIDPVPTATPGIFADIVAVALLTKTGALDTTFDGTGVAKFSDLSGANLQSGASQNPVGIFYQPDLLRGVDQFRALSQVVGSPWSVHAVLDRLNYDGSLDVSLKQDGLLATGITNPTGLITQPNPQIEVTGSAGLAGTSSLALLNGDGSLVKSIPIQGGIPVTYAAYDKVYLFSPGSFSATRINSDLTPDATFGIGGTANVSLPFPSSPPGAVVPAPARAEALAVGDTVLVGSNVTLDANRAPNPRRTSSSPGCGRPAPRPNLATTISTASPTPPRISRQTARSSSSPPAAPAASSPSSSAPPASTPRSPSRATTTAPPRTTSPFTSPDRASSPSRTPPARPQASSSSSAPPASATRSRCPATTTARARPSWRYTCRSRAR